MLGYLTIFLTSASAFAGAQAWVIGFATIALVSLAYAEHYSIYQRGTELGLDELIDTTLLASTLNALIASSASYGLGWLLVVFART